MALSEPRRGTIGFVIAPAFVIGLSCASPSSVVVTPPSPSAPAKAIGNGSFAGFDKRDFPGLDQMGVWMRESPFVWTGYYLASPCFGGQAWTGQRAQLEAQGWGIAVLYVGQQAPKATRATSDSNVAAAAGGMGVCGQNALTASQGTIDADQAAGMSAADGFSAGTTIFLDVERAEPYPAAMDDYVRAWVGRVLSRGYLAGIYGHKANAAALYATQRAAYSSANDTRAPPFWVANSVGFDFGKRPTESGFAFATIWQNPTDAGERYGSVTFRIDRNVASRRSPSAP
jgi:hypothetical protein